MKNSSIFRFLCCALTLGVALALFAGKASAQESPTVPPVCVLKGTVSDIVGPLGDVTVSLEPSGESTQSKDDGSYCFTSVPPGNYTVLAEKLGFAEVGVVDVDGSDTVWVLDLQLNAEVRENVVVTATRTRKGLEDVAIRTQVVSKDLIESTSARTLADAVDYTAGVRVESNCQNCNFSQIRLLGLQGPYTQILMDGQAMISSLAQVYGIEQIPTRMIDRIEVVKGGGSALYGPGAVGGVVNVIPREAPRTGGGFTTDFAGMGDDTFGDQPSVNAAGSFDWVSRNNMTRFTAFGQLDRVAPFDVDGDGFSEVSQRDLDAIGARVNHYVLGYDGKLTFDFNRMSEYRRGGDQLELPPDQAFVAEQLDSTRNAASVGWVHSPNQSHDYMLTASWSGMERDSYYGTFMDPNAFGDSSDSLVVLDGQSNHYLGRGHLVSWGGQFSSEALRDNQPAYDRFIDETYNNVGGFVQYDWAFARGWQLLAGVRADKHSTVDSVIPSPRLALMYSPQENIDIRASIATGFRAPQAFDEDLHLSAIGGEPALIFLSDDLREERSANFMLGAEIKPVIGTGQGLFEVNGFYTRLTDLFHNIEDDNPDTPMFEFLKVNLGGARVYGVELNIGWGIENDLVFQGGVVLQRSYFDEPEPDFGSEEFFRTPNVYGNFSATWNHQWASLFAGLRYTGPMKAPHYAGFVPEDRLETTPDFLTLDMYAAKPFVLAGRALSVTLGVRNLTNQFQPDLDRGPLRDASYVYGPRFPRTVRLGLRAEF
ncbi:MAG: TonB-dependent receptor [Acidobacteria bacterium]|nr:TonB-dependent receptor [Acidobacteriota bacterium]